MVEVDDGGMDGLVSGGGIGGRLLRMGNDLGYVPTYICRRAALAVGSGCFTGSQCWRCQGTRYRVCTHAACYVVREMLLRLHELGASTSTT